ncbi:DUF4258 domain-containing protein [Salinibacter grassmerensis]|uniref:DUF4258 domain-containing protein n=1 Tax=Salinibacter grassmerensis TaxID=3040353 RepID=UPI003C6E5613
MRLSARSSVRFLGADIRDVLETGEVFDREPSAKPFPKYYVLGWVDSPARRGDHDRGRPIHVVAADDEEASITCVLTVYEPDPDLWTDEFRKKQDD